MKTLSDQDAGHVNFTPVAATVAQLRSMSPPGTLPASSRIAPTELTVYVVTAQLVEFKQESDQDIHLVIADPSDAAKTMTWSSRMLHTARVPSLPRTLSKTAQRERPSSRRSEPCQQPSSNTYQVLRPSLELASSTSYTGRRALPPTELSSTRC